jgi:hypothetical protein
MLPSPQHVIPPPGRILTEARRFFGVIRFQRALLQHPAFVMRSEVLPSRGWSAMAGFRQHITFSTVIGVGYSLALKGWGWSAGESLLAGGLCGLAGMLPDLDSDSGKPVKEIFGLMAAVVSLFAFDRLRSANVSPADRVLIAGLCYLLVRFGVSWLFARLTVHRGMWHSLPAAFLVAEGTFLCSADLMGDTGSVVLGTGVFLGFVSHLVLDEIWSIHFKGVVPSMKRSAGSALKFASDSPTATLGTWLLLALISYQSSVKLGIAPDYLPSVAQTWSEAQASLAKLKK